MYLPVPYLPTQAIFNRNYHQFLSTWLQPLLKNENCMCVKWGCVEVPHTTVCSTSHYCLKLLGIPENITRKRIALLVWKFLDPAVLKIWENSDTCIREASAEMSSICTKFDIAGCVSNHSVSSSCCFVECTFIELKITFTNCLLLLLCLVIRETRRVLLWCRDSGSNKQGNSSSHKWTGYKKFLQIFQGTVLGLNKMNEIF